MTPGTSLLLAGAGLLAGAVNAIAGGGSLISFPALLLAGYPSVTANVTNTVALSPGYAGGAYGYRNELDGQRSRATALGVTSLVGALVGSVLLLTTSAAVFRHLVPYLILAACALLAVQPLITAAVKRRPGGQRQKPSATMHLATFVASVYGGYFGAGLGVMLLAILGIFVADTLQRLNGLKNVLSLLINLVAMVTFALFGPVAWGAAGIMAVTSLAGGYLGARVARLLHPMVLRVSVVGYGVVLATRMLVTG